MMRNSPRRLTAIIGGLMLTSCGTVMTQDPPHSQPPDTKAIVLRYLRKEPGPTIPKDTGPGPGNLFADVEKLGTVELSQPSLMQHPELGWTWLVCLRTHPMAKPASDYALFIGIDTIRDARLGVATDKCATQSYELLGRFNEPAKRVDDPRRRRTSIAR